MQLPRPEELATVVAFLRAHSLGAVEALLVHELQARAYTAVRAAAEEAETERARSASPPDPPAARTGFAVEALVLPVAQPQACQDATAVIALESLTHSSPDLPEEVCSADEYEDEEDVGYERLEVSSVSAFVASELAESTSALQHSPALAPPRSSTSSQSAPNAHARSASGSLSSASCGSLGVLSRASSPWAAARSPEEEGEGGSGPDSAEGAGAHALAVLLAARRRAAEWEAVEAARSDQGLHERAPPVAAEAEAELVRQYYEAREVFEFADAASGAAAAAAAALALAAAPFTEATPSGAASAGFLGGLSVGGFVSGFTFSPVSAAATPSPPMSLAGFSFRSATDDEGEDGDGDGEEEGGAERPPFPPVPGCGPGQAGHDAQQPHADSPPPTISALLAAAAPAERASPERSEEAPQATGALSPRPSSPASCVAAGAEEDCAAELEVFQLRVVHCKGRTGFEEEKDFPVHLGTVVAGRYQITEYLGSAAFSKAVQAHDLHTGALVCLKVIKNNKDFFDQSLDEIKLLKLLNAADPADEQGILRMYDSFYYKEHLFIVTELLRANLYEFQKYNAESGEAPYFTCRRLQSIATQVLRSLAFMHSLGLLHCDLKPENILIQSYSRCLVKVIDVGSSCFITDHLSSYVQSRSYRAPEVILGLPYDARIDVWSLGCILAELWSGHVLFQNDSLATLLARVSSILGPLPPRLMAGRHAHKFFTLRGELYERDEAAGRAYVLRPKAGALRHRLRGADPGFLDFLSSLLALDAHARPTALEALQHPWLRHEYPAEAAAEEAEAAG